MLLFGKRNIYILSGVLFVFSQLLCLKMAAVTQPGSKQVTYYKREWCRTVRGMKVPPGRKLVFFMGSSQTMAGLVPAVFDKENGGFTCSYNLALPATRLAPSYFMLKDYLRNNPSPDYIIIRLEPGGFNGEVFSDYSLLGAGIAEAVQYAVLSRDSLVFLDYLVPSRLFWPEVKQYITGKFLRLMPERIKELYRDGYRKRYSGVSYPYDWEAAYDAGYLHPELSRKENMAFVRRNRGYFFLFELSARGRSMPEGYSPRRIPRENLGWDEKDCAFLGKFLELTLKNNIKLILIPGYGMKQGRDAGDTRMKNVPASWLKIRAEFQNVYFPEGELEYKLYSPALFSDPRHLNYRGACSYTRDVAREFRNITGLQ